MSDMQGLAYAMTNQVQMQPVSAFLQGRAMQLAFEHDKMQNQMMQMQLQMYPQMVQHQMEMQKLEVLKSIAGINESDAKAAEARHNANAPVKLSPGESLYSQSSLGAGPPPDQGGAPQQGPPSPAGPGVVGAAAFGGPPPAGPAAAPAPPGAPPMAGTPAGPQPLVAGRPRVHVQSFIEGSNEVQYNVDEFGNKLGPPVGSGPRSTSIFNAPVAEADKQSQAELIAAGKSPMFSGRAASFGPGLEINARAKALNPELDESTYPTRLNTAKQFSSGPPAKNLQALNAASQHLQVMQELSRTLKNGDLQAFNTIANKWAEATGNPAPTNLHDAAAIVGQEIVKAIVPGGGSSAERDNAQKIFSTANSPKQFDEGIATVRRIFAGQLNALEDRYKSAPGASLPDFNSRPDVQTIRKAVGGAGGGGDHPADIQALIGKYGTK